MPLNSTIRGFLGHKLHIQMPVLNFNAHWIPWISITLLNTVLFGMKMNVNDLLCKKTSTYLATCICAQSDQTDDAPNRFAWEMLQGKTSTHKGHLGFQKFVPLSQIYDVWGAMFNKCLTDKRKFTLVCNGIFNINGMQTF